jgi:hypothetical protein
MLTAIMVMATSFLAQSLITEAQAAEPKITRDVRALEQNGSYLAGLNHRIKEEDSLMHKILTDAMKDSVDLEKAADGIGDVCAIHWSYETKITAARCRKPWKSLRKTTIRY